MAFSKSADTTSYYQRAWLLSVLWINVWMAHFIFGLGHMVSHSFPKKNGEKKEKIWNSDLSDHEYQFSFFLKVWLADSDFLFKN